jgi:hypothetical protein
MLSLGCKITFCHDQDDDVAQHYQTLFLGLQSLYTINHKSDRQADRQTETGRYLFVFV